jgi:hypothetical protein
VDVDDVWQEGGRKQTRTIDSMRARLWKALFLTALTATEFGAQTGELYTAVDAVTQASMQLIQLLVRHLLIGRNKVDPRPEFMAQTIPQLAPARWVIDPPRVTMATSSPVIGRGSCAGQTLRRAVRYPARYPWSGRLR